MKYKKYGFFKGFAINDLEYIFGDQIKSIYHGILKINNAQYH